MKMLVLFILVLPAFAFSQQASFWADAFRYNDPADTTDAHWNYINQMRWYLNGQELRWNADTIYIQTDLIPDTIIFRQSNQHKADTIICNIRHAMSYEFLYNPCCGGFNVRWNGSSGWGSVKFEVVSGGKKKYAGQVHETGIILHRDSANVVSPQCISAMAPNVYFVSLHEFRYCDHGSASSCKDYDTIWMACMNDSEYRYNPEYSPQGEKFAVTKTLFRFLYLPLSDEPLLISYDAEKRQMSLY